MPINIDILHIFGWKEGGLNTLLTLWKMLINGPLVSCAG